MIASQIAIVASSWMALISAYKTLQITPTGC
jgi:hypothetical protein